MNQWLTIFIGAIVVGIIVLIIGAGYTSANSSKLPQNIEMVQLFLVGSIIGGGVAFIITNGYLHGSTLLSMIKSDVSSSLKDIGLKGGEETSLSINSGKQTDSITSMVGGFFKSLGVNSASLHEMNVGMPSF